MIMKKIKKLKPAFTLAEVLITLGIIGVVAAMTIPGLINKYQKHVIESNLKETYSILQQTMRFTEYDDVSLDIDMENNDLSYIKSWFETFLQPHLKYAQVCYDESGCWQSQGATKTLSGGTAYCNRTGIGIGSDIVTIRLNNGANLCLDSYGKASILNYFGVEISDSSGFIIFIDANGDRAPNVIGKDIYAVVFTVDDGLVPAGKDQSNEDIDSNCKSGVSSSNAGYWCMMKVKNSGWVIPDDIWKIKV